MASLPGFLLLPLSSKNLQDSLSVRMETDAPDHFGPHTRQQRTWPRSSRSLIGQSAMEAGTPVQKNSFEINEYAPTPGPPPVPGTGQGVQRHVAGQDRLQEAAPVPPAQHGGPPPKIFPNFRIERERSTSQSRTGCICTALRRKNAAQEGAARRHHRRGPKKFA